MMGVVLKVAGEGGRGLMVSVQGSQVRRGVVGPTPLQPSPCPTAQYSTAQYSTAPH